MNISGQDIKVFRNLWPALKVVASLKEPRSYKKPLDKASSEGNLEEERRLLNELEHNWGVQVLKDFHIPITIDGQENIPDPAKGPVVFVSNHQGFVDIPAICATVERHAISFVARDNLWKTPFIGKWMTRIHCVAMNRENTRSAVASLNEAIAQVNNGYSMVIFPEGTRSRTDIMAPFKQGALRLATKPKVPIVPISLHGTSKNLEKQGYFIPAPVRVIVHPIVETANLTKEEEKLLSDKVFDIISEGVEKLKKEMDG